VFGSISLFGYSLPDSEHSSGARVFLVVGYAVAAWLWWRAGRQPKFAADALLWRLGAVLLFLLTLNKLFNLRLVSEAGVRALAKSGHWYDHRQPVQFAVAIVLPVALQSALFSRLFSRVFLTLDRAFRPKQIKPSGGTVSSDAQKSIPYPYYSDRSAGTSDL
jgi:hypothetical protein